MHTVNDVCGNNISPVLVNIVDSPNPLLCEGTREYIYEYTDCAGNSSIWTYTFTVNPLVINHVCPDDQNYDADPTEIYSIPELIVFDNCSGDFSISFSITGETDRNGNGSDASGFFNIGTSYIEWSITDICGNTIICSTEVNIDFPEIICPDNRAVCIYDELLLLSNTGENPENGFFSGDGVEEFEGLFYFNPTIVEAGDYIITYTWINENNYQGECIFTITVNSLPEFTATVSQHPLCFGDENGEVLIDINDGEADYTIDWGIYNQTISDNQFLITGLAAGIYSIEVTDNNGCSYISSVTLANPDILQAEVIISNDYNGYGVSCFGYNDGSASVIVSGGTEPYFYAWSASADNQLTQNAVNLEAGVHTVIVSDSNSCSLELDVLITEPNLLVVTIEVNNNVSCNGLTDGNATAIITGGTDEYTYLWNDSDNTTTSTASSLPAGIWTVIVTDSNSCEVSQDVIITEPDSLNILFSVNDANCFGQADGSAIANVSGGTPSYSYQWDDPNNSTTAQISNVSEGIYSLTVTDFNDCVIINSVEISQPEPLQIATSVNPVICGTSLGIATAIVNGGNGGYTYQWSNNMTGQQISGLHTGNYTVYVTDAGGCEIESSVYIGMQGTITAVISELAPISCYGMADAILIANTPNGASPLSFNWSNESTSQSINDVAAGLYNVQINDSWGCMGMDSYTVIQPPQISITFNTTNVSCYGGNDGSASAIASGGYPFYHYNWSNNAVTSSITGLSAGVFEVTVHDNNNCSNTASVIITQPESALNANIVANNISCYGYNDGSAIAEAHGGTPPYEYQWSIIDYSTNSQNIQNLLQGEYTLNITDSKNCQFSQTVIISEPQVLDVGYYFGNPSCIGNNNGFIELSVTGGTEPYIYIWDNGYSPINYIENLIQGTYLITVIDANECTKTAGPIILTDIDEECLKIPNAFTPNGDGVNDYWELENIHLYPNAYIKVFNRWGQILYEGRGTDDYWDGTFNGQHLPTATYLYVIRLYDGSKAKSGTVTIVY